MSIYRPADLTNDEHYTLFYLLGDKPQGASGFDASDDHRLGALRAASIKYPHSVWARTKFEIWNSYMDRIARAKAADDTAPIPGTTGSWCICGHVEMLHTIAAAGCSAFKGLTTCACPQFEPKGHDEA